MLDTTKEDRVSSEASDTGKRRKMECNGGHANGSHHGDIDTNLYSRQIGTYGLETMGKLIKLDVLIVGLRGVGIEIAKNIVLAGPRSLSLHDDALCEARDLGSNFFISMDDVGVKSRAEACVSKVAELNSYVSVQVVKGPLTVDVVARHAVVVCTDMPHNQLVEVNRMCRELSPQRGFISADVFGLASSMFVDFGDSFIVHDTDGEEPRSCIVAGITFENPATVHVHNDKPVRFSDGDYVCFKEVEGMEGINNIPPQKIKITGKHSFTIGDTTGFTPYTRQGVVYQVKMPTTMYFKSYSDSCTNPVPDGESCLAMPDLGKFGRSEQLHLAFLAVRKYWDKTGQRPDPTDTRAISECLQLAEEFRVSQQQSGGVNVDTLEASVIEKVAKYSSCQISPMVATIGGIAAQEIVKFTGKFTPTHQWLYMDAMEVEPSKHELDKSGGRYDDQTVMFGNEFQQKLANLKIFLVGAGALGCELLKSLALMGCCCGEKGLLTVTDMDSIEVSNLNRQFLFRREHVGESKSKTAASAAQTMNPDMHIRALETRVGIETEDTYTDAFWESQDIIINALDNINSRMYVDGRCVWFLKPLLDSGTLGTKANVQVVIPRMTQSYGDSQDPPEDSIPLCTLKHFPNQIEHTIEWSRDAFQGLFCDGPREAISFLSDSAAFLKRLNAESTISNQKDLLVKIKTLLSNVKKFRSFENCVEQAVLVFHDFFYCQLAQLLHTFPEDHVTSDGSRFWSGPKRFPQTIWYDANDEAHLNFVVAAANLLAYNAKITQNRDVDDVRRISAKVVLPEFAPKKVHVTVDEKSNETVIRSETGDEAAMRDSLIADLKEMEAEGASLLDNLVAVEFEKDDDSNFHIDFMAACANLRARNYKISECDRHKCKIIAGKIIPAIATTTAMATGMVGLEFLKTVDYKTRAIEDFRNSFVNLSISLIVMSEPMPPPRTVDKDYDVIAGGPIRARPNGFTPWDKVEIEIKGCTLQQLIDKISDQFSVSVSIMSVGSSCLYNSFIPAHKNRLSKTISELVTSVTKAPPTKKYVVVETSCSDPDGVDVITPTIKLTFC